MPRAQRARRGGGGGPTRTHPRRRGAAPRGRAGGAAGRGPGAAGHARRPWHSGDDSSCPRRRPRPSHSGHAPPTARHRPQACIARPRTYREISLGDWGVATSRRGGGRRVWGGDEGLGAEVGSVVSRPRPGRPLSDSERLEVALRPLSADPWYLGGPPAPGRVPPRLEGARPSPAGLKRPRGTSATPADLGPGRPAWPAASVQRPGLHLGASPPGFSWAEAGASLTLGPRPLALAPPCSRVSEGQPHLGSQEARTLSCTQVVRHRNPTILGKE